MYVYTSYANAIYQSLGHFSLVPGQPVEPSYTKLTVMFRREPNLLQWWDIEYAPSGMGQANYPVEYTEPLGFKREGDVLVPATNLARSSPRVAGLNRLPTLVPTSVLAWTGAALELRPGFPWTYAGAGIRVPSSVTRYWDIQFMSNTTALFPYHSLSEGCVAEDGTAYFAVGTLKPYESALFKRTDAGKWWVAQFDTNDAFVTVHEIPFSSGLHHISVAGTDIVTHSESTDGSWARYHVSKGGAVGTPRPYLSSLAGSKHYVVYRANPNVDGLEVYGHLWRGGDTTEPLLFPESHVPGDIDAYALATRHENVWVDEANGFLYSGTFRWPINEVPVTEPPLNAAGRMGPQLSVFA